MKKAIPFTSDLQQLETALAQIFVPVIPRYEFTSNLQTRLRGIQPATAILVEKADRRKLTLLSLAGLFAILAFVVAGFRTIAALITAIGLANEVGRQLKSRKSPPLTPAG